MVWLESSSIERDVLLQRSYMSEEERIRLSYGRRYADDVTYSLFNSGQLFMTQQLEKDVVRLLEQHGMRPLENRKVLEVGCGTGWPLRELIRLGANPENLCGVDLLPKPVEEAKRLSPNVDLRCGNAEHLPFSGESFDIVTQFTMFTSILDASMKRQVAMEMLRVVRTDGMVLWYDYIVSKPTNHDVKGIGKKEIIRLFPNCTFDLRRVTLAPPLARAIAPYSFLLCYLLEKIPLLRTHYLVAIRKKTESSSDQREPRCGGTGWARGKL
jgi:ubiquinone/menaquinone biosynthesis C-methylase UbiE